MLTKEAQQTQSTHYFRCVPANRNGLLRFAKLSTTYHAACVLVMIALADVAVLFYAGHDMPVNNHNY